MIKYFNQAALLVLKGKKFALKSFKHRNMPVYYLEGGNKKGPRLVILPGYGDSIFSWSRHLIKWSKHCFIQILDFPGYSGMSSLSKNGGTMAFEELETVAHKFFDDHVEKTDFLLGNSLGGWISVRLAAQNPLKIGHLILVNSAGVLTTEEEMQSVGDLHKISNYKDFLKLMDRFWHRIPAYIYVFSLMGYYQYTRHPRFMDLIHSIKEQHFMNESLPKIKSPVSVIWGTSDKMFKEHMARIIVKMIPKSRYYPIAKAGHMPQIERPREFDKIVQMILKN